MQGHLGAVGQVLAGRPGLDVDHSRRCRDLQMHQIAVVDVGHDRSVQPVVIRRRGHPVRDQDVVRPHGDAAAGCLAVLYPHGAQYLVAKAREVMVALPADDFRGQDVDLADELGHEARDGPLVDLPAGADLLDAAAVEDRNPVGQLHGLGLIVRHIDRRDAELALKLPQLELHRLAQLQVQGAERFIHQQDLRRVGDGPRERHPLLLTAADLGRQAVADLRQLDQVEQIGYPPVDRVARLSVLPQSESDVLSDGEVRKRRVVLEDHADAALLGRKPGYVRIANLDCPCRRLHEARDDAQHGGLAATRGTKQRYKFSIGNIQVAWMKGNNLTVTFRKIGKCQSSHQPAILDLFNSA